MSEATQALHTIASEAEVSEVRAEIAEEGAEIAEQRAIAAEEMAAEVFAAAIETSNGQRITALEERLEIWQSSIKLNQELQAEVALIQSELAELRQAQSLKTETSLIPPQLEPEQPVIAPEVATRPSDEDAQEKTAAEKPRKGNRAKARWI